MNLEQRIGWMVGFFEAEGSISLKVVKHPKKKTIVQVYIQLTNQVKAPLLYFAYSFGGTIIKDRGYYSWKIAGNNRVSVFLATIKPFALIKLEQILLAQRALAIQKQRGIGGRKTYTEHMINELLDLKQKIMKANELS